MKGERKPLLIVNQPYCQAWAEIRTLTSLTLPPMQTIDVQRRLTTKYHAHKGRFCMEGKPLGNLRPGEKRDCWEVEHRSSVWRIRFIVQMWPDNNSQYCQSCLPYCVSHWGTAKYNLHYSITQRVTARLPTAFWHWRITTSLFRLPLIWLTCSLMSRWWQLYKIDEADQMLGVYFRC